MNKKVISRNNRSRPNILERIRQLKLEAKQPSNAIFISGGIGDVIALEGFMTEEERNLIDTVYYATNKYQSIESFFKCLTNFPSLKNHIPVWTDFSSLWCFFKKEDCINRLKLNCPQGLIKAKDYGIMPIFKEINLGRVPFVGSSLLIHKIAEITRFQLPDQYFVVCPYSTDKRNSARDFNNDDWGACVQILKNKGVKGVVLNQGNDAIPYCDQIINLSNSCKLPECFEVVKNSIGYIGIDSAMSVLAAQVLNPPNIMIKSVNRHCYENSKCYYPTQNNMDYLIKSIKVGK